MIGFAIYVMICVYVRLAQGKFLIGLRPILKVIYLFLKMCDLHFLGKKKNQQSKTQDDEKKQNIVKIDEYLIYEESDEEVNEELNVRFFDILEKRAELNSQFAERAAEIK